MTKKNTWQKGELQKSPIFLLFLASVYNKIQKKLQDMKFLGDLGTSLKHVLPMHSHFFHKKMQRKNQDYITLEDFLNFTIWKAFKTRFLCIKITISMDIFCKNSEKMQHSSSLKLCPYTENFEVGCNQSEGTTAWF